MLNKIRRALGMCVHEPVILIKYRGDDLYFEYFCAVFGLKLDWWICKKCKKDL